jgi:hypothetical protein
MKNLCYSSLHDTALLQGHTETGYLTLSVSQNFAVPQTMV